MRYSLSICAVAVSLAVAACDDISFGTDNGENDDGGPAASCPPAITSQVTARDNLQNHPRFTHLVTNWSVKFESSLLKNLNGQDCSLQSKGEIPSWMNHKDSCQVAEYSCGGCDFIAVVLGTDPTNFTLFGVEHAELAWQQGLTSIDDDELSLFPNATDCVHYRHAAGWNTDCSPSCVLREGSHYFLAPCGADDQCGGVCSGMMGSCGDEHFCNEDGQCEEKDTGSSEDTSCDNPNLSACLASCGASARCVEVCCN